MTETLTENRRRVVKWARGLARQRQTVPVIRGDILARPLEDIVDALIETLAFVDPDQMIITPAADVVPCSGCDSNVPAGRAGRYCSDACRKHTNGRNAYRGRS